MPTERGRTFPSRHYVVARVRPASYGSGTRPESAPPEILEQFQGRAFTLVELEQRGVRTAGGQSVYTANGRDWWLDLSLALLPPSTTSGMVESVAAPEGA